MHILLVEDDRRLASLTREYLESHDAIVTLATDGDSGLRLALAHTFDVILLDLMLPSRDGVEVCQRIREHSDIPVIMLTARGEIADRVLGLEVGADDYMQKPYAPRELLARIHAVLRRARGQSGPRQSTLHVGTLLLDPGAHTARLGARPLDLTSYEFELLYILASRAGRVLSREQLMDIARGNTEEAFDRSIDVHISRLRKKLGDDPKTPRFIRTVRGIGYKFIPEPAP